MAQDMIIPSLGIVKVKQDGRDLCQSCGSHCILLKIIMSYVAGKCIMSICIVHNL